jgi:cytochrome c5
MRPKYLFTTISFVLVFAVVLVMLAIGFIPLRGGNQADSQSDAREVTVERVDVQIAASTYIPSTTEPLVSETASRQDGPSLLESHCAQCHNTQSLEQTKKSYAEWEKTLSHMETMGVHLDESEKVVLIKYLAVTDNPGTPK